MLLILTGIADGTVDCVIDHLESPFFRLNLDDFASYDFEMFPDSWSIKNPAGLVISSENATRCLWWKAFLYALNDDKYLKEEVRLCAQNLYSWFLSRELVIGNPPFLEAIWGKLVQASVAKNYFGIPSQKIGWGSSFTNNFYEHSDWVVKSLSSQLTNSGKAIFTKKVVPRNLDPSYPWYVQEQIDSDLDVTILVVGDRYFAFGRDRSDLDGLDWRKDQFTSPTKWIPYVLDTKKIQALNGFCREMGINWGRMDFLEENGELIFLEINPNGQWVFLDSNNETGIITAVAEYFENGRTHN